MTTIQEHKERHQKLHQALDELVADCLIHTRYRPSTMTVLQLMGWSRGQIESPTPDEKVEPPQPTPGAPES